MVEVEALIVGGLAGGLVGAGAGYQAGYNQRDAELQPYISTLLSQLNDKNTKIAELELRLKQQTLVSQIKERLRL
jgi:hypothetical protein